MAKTETGDPTQGNGSASEQPTQPLGAEQAGPDAAQVCSRCGADAGTNAYCASCGLHLEAEPELPTRAEWDARNSAARAPRPPSPAPTPAAEPAGSSIWQKVLIPMIGLVAVLALAAAVVAFVSDRPPSDSQLRRQLQSAQRTIAAQQTTINSIQANSQAGAVAGLKGQIQKFGLCVPEMQQEINGLNINTSTQNGWLTNAYLQNPTIISGNCQKVLYTSSNGP